MYKEIKTDRKSNQNLKQIYSDKAKQMEINKWSLHIVENVLLNSSATWPTS